MKWISVKDELPEEYETVLIYNNEEIDKGNITCAYWEVFSKKTYWVCNCNCQGWEFTRDYFEPTHWIPLPEAPEVKDEVD